MSRTPILDPIRQTILSCGALKDIHEGAVAALEAYAQSAQDDDIGFIYSNSLYDDATDNIFYTLIASPYVPSFKLARKFFCGTITIRHNATMQPASIFISPDKVRELGTDAEIKAGYTAQVDASNGFNPIFAHLMVAALDKLSTELNSFTPTAQFKRGL